MNSNFKAIQYFIFICVVVINITTLFNGIKHNETWQIIIGSISLALMSAALIILLVNDGKKKEASE